MTAPRAAPSPSTAPRWSLERRLPLLILALLACVIGAFSVAAYRDVRASAIDRATDRLERVTRELTASSVRNAQPRLAALRALAANPALRDAVRPHAEARAPDADRRSTVQVGAARGDRPAGAAQVASVLAAAWTPADSTLLGWEVWAADGRRRYRSGDVGAARDSAALATLRARMRAPDDSIRRSAMVAVDSAVHLWTAAPIRVDGRTVGVLAELRRLPNSAQSERAVGQIVGEDVHVLIHGGDGMWASLRGVPTAAPYAQDVVDDSAALVRGADGAPLYVVEGAVAGAPWHIVLLQPQASVLVRPRQTLRNLLAVGVVLLALGTVASWLLGRHVARPLRRVTDAAAALAGGDYAQRVPVTGAAELAGLASAFNAMAAGLGDAHATLAERNLALQRANEAKGEFLAMMSHELRTPLNAIGGYAELLEMGVRGDVTAAQVEDLGRIRRSKDHLLAVISDILTFSRGEAGALSVRTAVIAVADVFRDSVDMVGPQFQAKGVRLVVAPPPPDALIHGDREKVQQVLLNLLSNALKFTEPAGEVAMSCAVDGGTVTLAVRDTGIGIARERLADIFEPFVQVDASLTRRAGGSGLGLAISRHLSAAMGGTLGVDSVPGEGSCFVVSLPRAEAVDLPRLDAAVPARATAAAD